MKFENLPRTQAKIFFTIFVLSIACLTIFFSSKTSSQSLPDCSAITGTAEPGINCLFFSMPLCSSVSIPEHRVNCADLIDLPLCSDFEDQSTTLSGKNCVKQCSEVAFDSSDQTLVRGTDYAVHNQDCIRFCDSVESGVTASPGTNCTSRKCNQLPSGTDPNAGTNCDLMTCNLLVADELNDVKFEDSTKKYCDGDDIKCYEFVKSQLPYLKVRETNSMCQIHDCKSTCADDDSLNITNQESSSPGYTDSYINYITAGFGLDLVCNPVSCKPTVYRQYRCSPEEDENPTTLNSACDSTGSGSTCSGGYCYKTIDCNLSSNASESECVTSTTSDDGTIGSTADTMDSWFYRPKPMDKAISGSGILREMQGDLCYSQSQMESYGWGWHPEINILGIHIDLGYYHSMFLPDQTRSPGMCALATNGLRGTGYYYLCGNNGSLYDAVSDYTGYHQGYAVSEFVEGDATHKLKVCLRFKNFLRPDDGTSETCGARECGISCLFGVCKVQSCGFDVCKELTLKDSNSDECIMDSDLASGDPSRDCMATIDSLSTAPVRVRAVKYDNRICTFLDVKGQTAYGDDLNFFDGTEKLSDGTCISGSKDSEGNCNGKDTNDDKWRADRWRTILKIPYIQNNQSGSSLKGYLDSDGRLFPEQECIKTSLRVAPPKLYNLATTDNSTKLFMPPLYVLNVRAKRGGNISTPASGETFGSTDFHYPEVELQFGSETQKLSLGLGYIGNESTADAAGSATITSNIAGITASVEVFAKKEYDRNSAEPVFCIYRKVKDQFGDYFDSLLVQCVKRNLPEIDNVDLRAIDASLDPRKVAISADSANSFNSSKIILKYLASFGSNNVDDNCGSDDLCTSEVKLENTDPDAATCDSAVESYEICAQREECSKLTNECAQNEIDLNNAQASGASTSSYLAVRQSCDSVMLPLCNAKKGITSSSTTLNYLSSPASASGNYYGWFNELCITSGFNEKLKTIIAYKMSDGMRGKCVVDPSSPYLIDSNSSTNCDDGGKAPNCLCLEYVEGVVLDSTKISRNETPREAGLCIDMPMPATCAAIDYNPTPNSDTSDLEYVSFSLNKTSYNDSNGVHTSHQARTAGTSTGYAEFPESVLGMNDIAGECNGFWKKQTNTSGVSLSPKLSCLNVNGAGQWSTSITNSCIRYSCSAITTAGPDATGDYQGNYGDSETGEDKGLSNGYATWPDHLQITDFPENVSASECIYGFKKTGSSAITSGGVITGYSGGSLPTRKCNQIGEWQTTSNNCQRISCAAVSPATPTSSSDTAAWSAWYESGGATFPAVNASRSNLRIQSESISYGTCNNSLGFFQASGAPQPSRECDYLGNWGQVKDECVTQCDAITSSVAAENASNGYAYWPAVTNVSLGSDQSALATTCVSGYLPYPYPPLKNAYGTAFTLTSGVADYTTTIPQDVTNDSRSAAYPERVCQSVTNNGTTSNIWTGTSSSCIDQCPGYTVDARIGVGVTQHSTSSGTISVNWPSTSFNQTAYFYSPATTSQHDASKYFYGRTNGYYILARYCNSNGKWSDPVPQCATNGGEIVDASSTSAEGQDSNATYTTTPTGSAQIVAINSAAPTGVCISDYYKGDYNTATVSSYTCSYKDSSNKIDQVYFKYVSGKACKRYCMLANNQSFTNSYFAGTLTNNGYYDVGSSITLKCNSNYGSKLVYSGSRTTDTSYDCGETAAGGSTYYTSSVGYRGATYPSATCQSSGAWSSVGNGCEACRSCNFSSGTIAGTTSGYVDSCSKSGANQNGFVDFSLWLPQNNFSLSHGDNHTYECKDSVRCNPSSGSNYWACTTGTVAISCVDGIAKASGLSLSRDGSACSGSYDGISFSTSSDCDPNNSY